jgi:hypothetical protein
MIQIIFLLAQNTHLFINLSIDIDWDGLKEYYDRKKNKKKSHFRTRAYNIFHALYPYLI